MAYFSELSWEILLSNIFSAPLRFSIYIKFNGLN